MAEMKRAKGMVQQDKMQDTEGSRLLQAFLFKKNFTEV